MQINIPNGSNGHYVTNCHNGAYVSSTTNRCCNLAHDTCLSDDTYTDTNTYYEYFPDNGYAKAINPGHLDCKYSDDSSSTRLPYYEIEDLSSRRHSRHGQSERSYNKKVHLMPAIHKDLRKVYPNQNEVCDRLCQEAQRCMNEIPIVAPPSNALRRGPLSRFSDRPESSQSSEVTSAIVDGCGGHCQTFENVCYYFLQVAFTMGILIGASLCIAGALLRKSAARNLQVLVYIGALLFLVCLLLLGVQCNARKSARKRKKALRNAKRTVIPLETLQSRNVPAQQPLIVNNTQRFVSISIIITSFDP